MQLAADRRRRSRSAAARRPCGCPRRSRGTGTRRRRARPATRSRPPSSSSRSASVMMPVGREHRRVGARLLDVVGREAPVEADRRVHGHEDGIGRQGEAGHGPGIMTKDGSARPPRGSRRPVRPAALRVREAVLHRLRGQRAARAEAAAARLRASPGHAASYELLPCRATSTAELVGVVAGFPVARRATGSARRFVQLTLPALPPWRWPGDVPPPARRRATSRPSPPLDAYYVDALAVDPAGAARASPSSCSTTRTSRRARAGLRPARARHRPAERARARALYEAYGFGEREIRRAPDDRTARALGGPGLRRLPQGRVEHAPAPRRPRRPAPSVISGKNGSAIERAATSSQTGNSPSRWPKRSR